MSPLFQRRFWVFDMDNTLTQSALDFPKIKAEMGLPSDRGILETLAELSGEEARAVAEKLDLIEHEAALLAKPAPGVFKLLSYLQDLGARVGIVTRNRKRHAFTTLEATGLTAFFPEADVLGRDEAAPKPSPDGVLKLLAAWTGTPDQAVMVGDYLFDLQAGRAAGAATVYVDPSGVFPFQAEADVWVTDLGALLTAP